MIRAQLVGSVAALALMGTAAFAQGVKLAIPEQALAQSLKQIAQQTGANILFTPDTVDGFRARAINGQMSAREAVSVLIVGTNLEIVPDDNGGLIVQRKGSAASGRTPTQVGRQHAAQSDGAAGGQPESSEAKSDKQTPPVEKVTVTGTRIRGSSPASPVIVIDREKIDRSGAGTVQDLLAKLPQNFGGGESEVNNAQVGSNNTGLGAGVNLRGLGTGSTLVLLNGRRMSTTNTGNFVDVSLIPLAAVERIEVLTDGASAIYGSDAIGGVVNIILKRSFTGVETQAHYGETSDGGGREFQSSVAAGYEWGSGNLLAVYEYYQHDPIVSGQRDFSEHAPGSVLLTPGILKNSYFVSGRQELTTGIDIFGEGYDTDRNGDFLITVPSSFVRQTVAAETKQSGGTAGFRADLWGDWSAEVSGSYATNDITALINIFFLPPFPPLHFVNTQTADNTLWSVDAKADGSLFELPGGDVRLAIGASHRGEKNDVGVSSPTATAFIPSAERQVSAVFGEMLLPIVGEANRMDGIELLELSVAGRYEDYDDFGSTFNPKYGVRWSPGGGVMFRGTYATSFKAPTLDQTNDYNRATFLETVPDAASPTGFTRVVVRQGNNADLREETSTSWTAGVDIAPPSWEHFSAKATYYNVDFTNRITTIPFFGVLSDPTLAGVLLRRGSIPNPAFDAMVADLLSHPPPFTPIQVCGVPLNPNGSCPEPVTNFNAILDDRVLNLASTRTDGVDLSATYALETDAGAFSLDGNVNYTFNFRNQNTKSQPEVQSVDTVHNVPDLRGRFSVTWSQDGLSATTTINYTDDYINNVISPSVGINSWTTVDLNLSYQTKDQPESFWLQNILISLTANNLFDRDPPFFGNNPQNTGYDPSNANPVGRFVSFQIRKSW